MRGWLMPAPDDRDEGFEQEVFSLSSTGLYVAGAVEIAIAIVLLIAHPFPRPNLFLGALGVATIAIAGFSWSYEYCRSIGNLSTFAGASLQAVSMAVFGADDYALGGITVLLLTLIAAIPVRPLQALAVSGGVAAAYAGALRIAGEARGHFGFLVILALLSTALAAVLYAQRYGNYRSFLDVIRASQDLREAQSRLQLTGNAASMGRLSAALAHELSSPVGALSSAVDTIILLSEKQAQLPASEQPRLLALQEELRESVKDSAARLKRIVNRMQRFNNLDEAETQVASVAELITEAVAIIEPHMPEGSKVNLDLAPLPHMSCRPQQLIAVFCNLLNNSMEAVNGSGRITVSARTRHSQIEVEIRDNGRGISSETLAHIFDPGFKTVDGRVSTGNWSLFSSRQIVHEHGGDIRIRSALGEGTTVSVLLPCPT